MEERNKVRNWASIIDQGTLLQAEKSARSPGVGGPIALMPDAHVGMGATIGSVIPTKNTILPAAVGVDLGCGMIAARLEMNASRLPDNLGPLHGRIAQSIPAGVGRGHVSTNRKATEWLSEHPNQSVRDRGLIKKTLEQLGSLGSGNHFFELCLDELDRVWIVLHSGSRGVGNILASAHIKLAYKLEQGLEDRDLAYFTQGTPEFENYITDMLWAQDYALQNREMMYAAALTELRFELKYNVEVAEVINCHHNFAAKEVQLLDNVLQEIWVTRKGAIRAEVGDQGVIPGSMGAASYIVEGKGCAESYMSCAHGAGRMMSRKQAKRELSVEDLAERMTGKVWNDRSAEALLDEHPLAYKDIDQVMKDQQDLVTVNHVLHQVLNYKGV